MDHKFVLFMSCVCHAFASVHCCLAVSNKGMTSWLLFVVFNCVLSLSHVQGVKCPIYSYIFLYLEDSPIYSYIFLYLEDSPIYSYISG